MQPFFGMATKYVRQPPYQQQGAAIDRPLYSYRRNPSVLRSMSIKSAENAAEGVVGDPKLGSRSVGGVLSAIQNPPGLRPV